mgnify:CR=1 FL=1
MTKEAEMAAKKVNAAKTAKKVEKAVKSATSKVKAAVKKVAKQAEKVVAKVASKAVAKPASAKKPVKAVAKAKPAAPKKSVKVAPKANTKSAAPTVKMTAIPKSTPKSVAKTTAKTAVKPAAKPAAKIVKAKLAAKPVAKPAAKSASKSAVNPASMEQSFNAEYLVLMQKDPNWMQAFWEVSEKRIKEAKKGKGKLVIRLFDISGDLTIKRSKKLKFRDVEVPANARSWYVENKATENCVAVLGVANGSQFMPIVEGAPVQTFSMNGATIKGDDIFVKASLGNAAMGGFGSSGLSSMSAQTWLESLSSSSGSMFSGALSSAALKSNALELPKDSVSYGKDFFLWVKTRLIVYGGTRPDAHLQVRGEPFPLNPDGTFSFEEDLPDSNKIIPVFATDKDGDFPTTIVPIVVKRTE